MSMLTPRWLRLSLLGALAAVFVSFGEAADAQPNPQPRAVEAPIRVMTFNIRYDNPADGPDAWPHRSEGVAGLIRFHDPDLLGLQEAQRHQLEELQRLLPRYGWFGLPRADGGPSDEYSAILYRTERFDLLDHGTFWLSETPAAAGSRGWDARLPRIATWGRFRDRSSGETLMQINTHFDHIGVQARAESARLLKRWLAETAGELPILLTGDFNAPPESEPIRILADTSAPPALRDAWAVSDDPPYGPNSTWNAFRSIEPGRRIDFIFVGNGVRVLKHAILSDTLEGGRFPSDHLPVLADVVIEAEAGSSTPPRP
jgi:endonuclease/exonuclease/phosphatase family metal-dependent hydrolase